MKAIELEHKLSKCIPHLEVFIIELESGDRMHITGVVRRKIYDASKEYYELETDWEK